MFGYQIPNTTAYCGWRAILSHGSVDILHDRCHFTGEESATKALVDLVNKSGAWKRMIKWAKGQSGNSRDIFEEVIGNMPTIVLKASPQASYGYLYIGLAVLEPAAAATV
jgi:hypothetical protein